MPMTFDQYNNCGHYCLYCFSTFQRDIRGNSGSKDYAKREEVKAVSVKAFKRKFDPDYKGVFSYIIKNRKPMQWGGLSDPFCPLEKEFGVGLEILQRTFNRTRLLEIKPSNKREIPKTLKRSLR
jgi:DNA repair photolyase